MTDVARACGHKLGQVWFGGSLFAPLSIPLHSTTTKIAPSFCALEQCLLFLSALKQVMLLIQQSHPHPYTVIHKLMCVNPKKHMILQK